MNNDYSDELDFTAVAWESLYDTVDNNLFFDCDSEMIYDSLQQRLKMISFGDYLKRYIYLKAELSGSYNEIPLADYQYIIRESFADNRTPASFTPTTAKLSALSKNWLSQQTVKRNVVFLLGFGLGMGVDDVNRFLTKALREPEINPKNPFEVICWYCYKNRLSYLKFEQLFETYKKHPATDKEPSPIYSEYTVGVRNVMLEITDEVSLMLHLSGLKSAEGGSNMSVTAREQFERLYTDARAVIADTYNQTEDEEFIDLLTEYKIRLSNNSRLSDYEIAEKIDLFRNKKRHFTKDDVSESDVEHFLCSAIPTDRNGNLTPSKKSKLNEQFAGKRFSRQHIAEIISKKCEITRFDLITLNFIIFSQKLDEYPNSKNRYQSFIISTNDILEKCLMGDIYISNPYECFVLMCILSEDPLGTYADVWELSYGE